MKTMFICKVICLKTFGTIFFQILEVELAAWAFKFLHLFLP